MTDQTLNTQQFGAHPFALNGEQLLAKHMNQCRVTNGLHRSLQRAAWQVHECFGHRFATSVVAGLLVIMLTTVF
jgi:hypothetical protein